LILIQCERVCTENVKMFGKKIFKNRKIELLHSLKLSRCNGGIRRWIVTKKVVHEGKKIIFTYYVAGCVP
jgi:hypothetical protein